MEQIIFQRDVISLKKIIVEINDWFDKDYNNTKRLSKSIASEIKAINKNLIIRILYLIYEFLDKHNPNKQSSINEGIYIAYEILLKCFNNCTKFDLVTFNF